MSLSSRFAVRNFLRTGVYRGLAARVGKLVVLGHEEDLPAAERAPNTRVLPLQSHRTGALDAILGNLTFQVLARRIGNQTIQIRNRELRRDRPSAYVKKVVLSRPFGRSLRAARALGRLNSLLHPDRRYAGIFRKVRPDLYFATNLLDPQEAPILRRARAEGIFTVGQVLSWDNLSSKGVIPEPVDSYVVWNDHMAAELDGLYGVARERIAVTGAPQFDCYVAGDGRVDQADFLSGLGLVPTTHLLTYAGSTQRLVPGEPRIVEEIRSALTGVDLPSWHLRVRIHPFDDASRWDGIGRLPGVSVERAGAYGERGWAPTESDQWHLANLLRHSSVVVNVASTTTIDAAALDRPVVNVAFDPGGAGGDWLDSVRRYYDFHHYRRIVATRGVRIARSAAECAEQIRDYVRDPARDREGRTRIVEEQCHRLDGRSAARVVDALAHWMLEARGRMARRG